MLPPAMPSTVHTSSMPGAVVLLTVMLQFASGSVNAALHSPSREHSRPARLPALPAWLRRTSLRSCLHWASLLAALVLDVLAMYCLHASNTASLMANLSELVLELVLATISCRAATHAPHAWQGVSSMTGGAGGAGRGWQVLRLSQESWPALQVHTVAWILALHMGLVASMQSVSLLQLPTGSPAQHARIMDKQAAGA